jgi:cell division protein FtsZ
MGMALMGTGRARGENRAIRAAQEAISNPLLEDVSIKGARGVLVNITGGPDMKLKEANEAVSLIHEEAHEEANIIFGSVVQENLGDEIRVTVIATGLSDASRMRRKSAITESFENVTPLRLPLREAATAESLTEASLEAPRPQARVEANGTNDFVSPFEEEYDVPAFIRRTRETD